MAPEPQEPLNFDRHADEAPHKAWQILSDSVYAEFDPLGVPEQLGASLYERTFGSFLAGIDRLLADEVKS